MVIRKQARIFNEENTRVLLDEVIYSKKNVAESIAWVIRRAIECGKVKPGDRLPGILLISRRYGVAMSTVKRSFDILKRWGLVSSKHRDGTYVNGSIKP